MMGENKMRTSLDLMYCPNIPLRQGIYRAPLGHTQWEVRMLR